MSNIYLEFSYVDPYNKNRIEHCDAPLNMLEIGSNSIIYTMTILQRDGIDFQYELRNSGSTLLQISSSMSFNCLIVLGPFSQVFASAIRIDSLSDSYKDFVMAMASYFEYFPRSIV